VIRFIDIGPALADAPAARILARLELVSPPAPAIQPLVVEMVRANARMAERTGAPYPWRGHLAVTDELGPVGACAFKDAPEAGTVEIAYVTFPPYERRGYATRMAGWLLEQAQASGEVSTVLAHTLPEASPSTAILERHGFERTGEVHLPDDGLVWRWQRALAR
jgi:ribosomal-protein-alanine N-acetyltransferase